MNKIVLAGFILVLVIGMGLGYSLAIYTMPKPQSQMVHLIFQLDYQFGLGRHAPFFVALAKGYFAAEGLDVEFLPGSGSSDTIAKVAAGTADLGYADFPTLIRATAANPQLGIKMIMVIQGKAPHAIFALQSSGIKTPKDLEGKKIAGTTGAATVAMFPAFAKLAGFDASKVTWVMTTADSVWPLLLTHQVDAIIEYILSEKRLDIEAAKLGDKPVVFLYADYGFNAYGNGVIAKNSFLTNNPDVARRFLSALAKGMDYTWKHPNEALQILVQRSPMLDQNTTLGEIDGLSIMANTTESQQYGQGYMTLEKVQTTINLVYDVFSLGTPTVKPEDVYTMAYHPGQVTST